MHDNLRRNDDCQHYFTRSRSKANRGFNRGLYALLNQNGYQAYSFDISPMKDVTFQVQFEVREYVAGNPEPVSAQPYGIGLKNRTMVKEFFWRELSEEEVAEIKVSSVDYENGVYPRSEKITVGFLPCENDSTEVGRLYLENQGSAARTNPAEALKKE